MHEYFTYLQIGRTFRLLYTTAHPGWLTKVSKQVAITQSGKRVRLIKDQAVSTLAPYNKEKSIDGWQPDLTKPIKLKHAH